MKSLMTIWVMVMMMMAGQAFGQANTTIVKTIAPEGNTALALALAGNVNVTEYDGETIRIVATIEVTNSSENILQRLVTLGRYNIETKVENGQLTIHAPKMANHIAIQGTDLIEIVRYEISVPRGMQHQVVPTFHSNVMQSI